MMNTPQYSTCVLFGSFRPWDPEHCLIQFEKDGIIQTQEKSQKQHDRLSFSWASRDKVR